MKNSCSSHCLVAVALATSMLVGCRNLDRTQNGALVGSGLGALLGTIIGHQTGDKEKGALIGALAGGAAGGLIGNAQQNAEERDDAIAYAHHQSAVRETERRAISNADVVNMVQNNVEEATILDSIRATGGNFDVRPDSLIRLANSGVNKTIIAAMMSNNLTP